MSYIYGEEKSYIITESKLRYLLDCAHTLEALQSGGVDNWSWYSDSINDYCNEYNENKQEDFCISDIVDKEIESYKEV